MATSFENRRKRLDALEQSVTKYVDEEKKRIEREVTMLESIATARGWGDLNQPVINSVKTVAESELKAFLDGA
jgi:putative intracellular protease/amidase